MGRLVHPFAIPSYTLGDPVFLLIPPLLCFFLLAFAEELPG